MVNQTTRAFRRMMINGRLNELMTEAVQDGIEATAMTQKTMKLEHPTCIPSKLWTHKNLPDAGSESEIPDHAIKEKSSQSDYRQDGERIARNNETK